MHERKINKIQIKLKLKNKLINKKKKCFLPRLRVRGNGDSILKNFLTCPKVSMCKSDLLCKIDAVQNCLIAKMPLRAIVTLRACLTPTR